MTLISRIIGQLFRKVCLSLGFSSVFSWLKWGNAFQVKIPHIWRIFSNFVLHLLIGIPHEEELLYVSDYLTYMSVDLWILILFYGLIWNYYWWFCCSDVCSFSHEELLQAGFAFFELVSVFFQCFLTFWTHKLFQTHPVFSVPAQIQLHLLGALFTFIGWWCLETKIWAVGALNITGSCWL